MQRISNIFYVLCKWEEVCPDLVMLPPSATGPPGLCIHHARVLHCCPTVCVAAVVYEFQYINT